MKNILSLSFVLVTLISIATLTSFRNNTSLDKRSNAKWSEGPSISDNSLVGRITGIGNGDLSIYIEGDFACINPGSNEPPSWQEFDKTETVPARKNGNTPVDIDLPACPKVTPRNGWTTGYQNVYVTVSQGGVVVIDRQRVY